MLGERGAAGGEAAEHESLGGLAPGDAAQGQVEPASAAVPVAVGISQQLAVVAVGPAVIGTAEGAGVAALVRADLVAAVSAAVDQQVNLSLLVPGRDQILRAEGL